MLHRAAEGWRPAFPLKTETRERFRSGLFFLLAAGLPLAWLVVPGWGFRADAGNTDWEHLLWISAYHGAFLGETGWFPEMLASPTVVGGPAHLCYGALAFPLLGLLSFLAGASWALRLAVLAACLCQVHASRRLARSLLGPGGLADALALALAWSVYALTNLYSRQAVFELIAVKLLAAAVFHLLASPVSEEPPSRTLVAGVVLLGTLVVGTHPPTALAGAIWLGPLLLVAMPGRWVGWQRRTGILLGALLLAGLLLAPQLLLLGSAAGRSFRVVNVPRPTPGLEYFPERSDSLAGRLSPVPYDRSAWAGVERPAPAHLEAPLASGLVLAAGVAVAGLAFRRRAQGQTVPVVRSGAGRTGIVATGLAVVLTGLSVGPVLGAAVDEHLGPYLQFGYRWTAHGEILLFIAAVHLLAVRPGAAIPRAWGGLAAGILALSGLGFGLKLVAAVETAYPLGGTAYGPRWTREAILEPAVSSRFVAFHRDYSTPGLFPGFRAEAGVPGWRAPLAGGTPGDTLAGRVGGEVDLPQAGWLLTNVLAFPWNEVRVDGRPPAEWAQVGGFLAVRVEPGRHGVGYAWSPPAWWRVAFGLSRGALLAVVVLGVAGVVARGVRLVRRTAAALPVT